VPLTHDARVRTFVFSGKGKHMSDKTQPQDGPFPPTFCQGATDSYCACFTVDGPQGRQIDITVVAPSEALALGVAQNAMLGLVPTAPPAPERRSGLQDYLNAIGEGLGRVMVQSGVFMHDRPSGEPDAEFDDEPSDADPEEAPQ